MFLAIDTSVGTSVAVVDREAVVLAGGGTERTRRGRRGGVVVLGEGRKKDTMGHAEVIGELIRDVLAATAGASGVTAVAAGMGPGPFTGLRVGIAAARAFALGVGCPVIPVLSHDAIAREWYRLGGESPVQIVTDARRRESAVSSYRGCDRDGLPVRTDGPELWPVTGVPEGPGSRVSATRVSAGDVGALAALAVAANRLPLIEDTA